MMRCAGLALAALCLLLAGCSARGSVSGAQAPTGSSSPPASVSAAPSATAASTPPVLGQSRRITRGYGSVRPRVLDNGGDPTGILANVSWRSWGGAKAVGSGMGYYDPPNTPVSASVRERATVVAFDLGTCEGQYMYQAIEWYFPESGGTFSPGNYLDVCAWTFHQGNR